MEISLCMIVRNEEGVLDRCLKSVVDFVDEIVIVDTGSNDSTKKIASEFGAAIYDFKWCDDFSRARNYSFSKATKDYIFWLDADDYITEDNVEKIKLLKKELTKDIKAVSMNYSLVRDEDENTLCSIRRNRLLKREKQYKWTGRVHEYIEVHDKILSSDICINHDKDKASTDRNLKIYNKMIQSNEKFSLRDIFYYGNELLNNGFYKEAISQYEQFINSDNAWSEDVKLAVLRLCECYTMINEGEKNINIIANALKYIKPNARMCCVLGGYFMEQDKFEEAIFWYESALRCIPSKQSVSINLKDEYTWIPSIKLFLCYSSIGDFKTAQHYNELAGRFKPDSIEVIHNRRVLEGLLN